MKLSAESVDFIRLEESGRQEKSVYYACLITPFVTLAYVAMFWANHLYFVAFVNIACVMAFFSVVILIKTGTSASRLRFAHPLIGAVSILFNNYYIGALHSPGLIWLVAHPALAVLVAGRRQGIIWTVIDMAYLVAFYVMTTNGYHFPTPPSIVTNTEQNIISGLFGVIILIMIVVIIFENSKNAALIKLVDKNRIIEDEKRLNEELVLNILPKQVATELKEKGYAEAHLFDNVTVLFTDFVNFTLISEKLQPNELVSELNVCFKVFDEITEKFGIEKIKTVGDAYLAVCGLPSAVENHAEQTVRAALEMRDFIVKRYLEVPDKAFNVRIGIHTGSVVAGIVGIKKFAYDIWGDTVNTAARMEQKSEPGKINVSGRTYELVKDAFECQYRGKIEAKHKGEIDMYFVNEKRREWLQPVYKGGAA